MYTRDQNDLTIHFPPNLDTVTCLDFEDELYQKVKETEGAVIFDLCDVNYIASMFLRICLRVTKDVGPERLRICSIQPAVMKVFKISALDKHLTLEA